MLVDMRNAKKKSVARFVERRSIEGEMAGCAAVPARVGAPENTKKRKKERSVGGEVTHRTANSV